MNIVEIDVDKMNEYGLTPNGWFVLHYIYHGKSYVVSPTLTEMLINQEFITEEYELTDKGKEVFKQDVKQLKDNEIKEFLKELREFFPKGITINGSPVRTTIGTATVRKLRGFINEYGYSKELMLEATKAYVAAKKKDNYSFMMKFTNFINKQNVGSELATYCQMIEDGDDINGKQETRITRTL